jgi:hypothetical protein
MPPLLLDLLAPLLRKRDTWYLVVILVLLFFLVLARSALKAANAALAARPAVHTEAEQKVQVVRVAGPVKVETKTVYVPGTTQVQYVERVVERAPVTTTTEKESEIVKDVRPACPPAPARPWREASVLVDPLATSKLVGLDGSVTLGDRLVLGAGGRIDRGGEGHARIGVRF